MSDEAKNLGKRMLAEVALSVVSVLVTALASAALKSKGE